jgi:predicted secreted protein
MKALTISIITALFLISACKEDLIVKEGKPDFEISIGETISLSLISNRTTGYSWIWVNRDQISIVDTFDFDYIVDDPTKIGSGGKEIWNFIGKNTGTDTIKLEYKRLWEPNSTVESKKITVVVK